MKCVILAGGYGTRISEESGVRPKPMVEIGGKPILWHIMKIYSAHGIDDFVVCVGYKGSLIKDYFANYSLYRSDVTFDFRAHDTIIHSRSVEPWRVTLVDTGENTMTGGRLRRVRDHVGDDTFCMTYGDGLSDIDISELVRYHGSMGVLATMTAVQPPGRFGAMSLAPDEDLVTSFREKPAGDEAWINGGFFVLEPGVFDYLDDDGTIWEREPLTRLAEARSLAAYKHRGYWQNLDTLRDKMVLEEQWESGAPPWQVWADVAGTIA
ncbi:MAG: glucose-1-phosphate cytidylyltransferase [Gaiellaceae bacterium]